MPLANPYGALLPPGQRVRHTESKETGSIVKQTAWQPTENRPFYSYYVRWDAGGLGYVDGPFLKPILNQ